MQIEIYADVVCPWCYIGTRRLHRALGSYGQAVDLRWRAFQLDPGAVSAGRPLTETLAAKFGGPARLRQIFAYTASVAREEGLELNFEKAVGANTFDAHRLSWNAASIGKQAGMVDALYRAHFTTGLDIGSHEVLASIAEAAGVPEAGAVLASSAGAVEVRAEMAEARDLGIRSVPTFVFEGRYAVSGAQDPSVLLATLDEVSRATA